MRSTIAASEFVMTEEQKHKVGIPAPKNMSGKGVAAWLRKGIIVRHKNEAAQKEMEEAKRIEFEKMEILSGPAKRNGEKILSIRANALEVVAIKASKKSAAMKVASVLWMPQLNLSLRGFGSAITLIVQIFAQALIAVGLLPPDHPARKLSGAKGYKVFNLLEEARLSLLPFKLIVDNKLPAYMADIRAHAMRQYIMFSAIIGLLVTSGLTAFFGLSKVLFFVGTAHAASSPTTTSGLLVGFCPSSIAGSTDFASACIDNIFGTGSSSGTTASLISSGLGAMLRLYSNMVLVFAGIIVLWIIISAVAETARTGVPFGKNFNSVWAPIRLIVALGLLMPLGSGLNSGQYIVISLAKWGSQQATSIWNGFQNNLVNASTGGSQTISGLTSVSFDEAQARLNAAKMMEIALCSAVQNQTCTDVGGQSCNVQPQVIGAIPQPNAVGNVSAAGGTPTAAPLGTVPTKTGWFVSSGTTPPSPIPGYPNCGSVTVTLPSSSSSSSASNQNASSIAQVAQTNAGAVLTQSAANLVELETKLQSVANKVEADAQTALTNNDSSSGEYPTSQLYSDYNSAVTDYITKQEQTTIPANLTNYNTQLTQAVTQLTQQNNGWISTPVWLLNIMMANGTFEDSIRNSGISINEPAANINDQFTGVAGTAGNNSSMGADNPQSQWPMVNEIWRRAIANQGTIPSGQSSTYQSIISPLQSLTQGTSINPLASAGTYGRDLLTLGVFLIQPQKEQACYMGNTSACLDNKDGKSNMQNLLPNMNNEPYPWAQQLITDSSSDTTNTGYHAALFPVGMMLISMGIMLVILPLLLMMRFISGILNWIMLIFEAVIAQPMNALSLLNTTGDGFMTQQFQTNMVMLLGIILRPPLMVIGTVLSIAAFGTIMQITNLIFASSLENMPLTSSGALLSLGIYGLIYALLAYTLANSAFKLIDLMPNWVMNWIGARMEQRADDVGGIQQQVSGFTQTLSYTASRGGGSSLAMDKFTKDNQELTNLQQAQAAAGGAGHNAGLDSQVTSMKAQVAQDAANLGGTPTTGTTTGQGSAGTGGTAGATQNATSAARSTVNQGQRQATQNPRRNSSNTTN